MSGVGIGQLEWVPEQDPDHVWDDVCVVERQVTNHPPDLHSYVLRRCFQQADYARHDIAECLVNDCEEDPGRVGARAQLDFR